MKLSDIITAYNATNELADVKELSPANQWAIYKFRKDAKTQLDFYNEKTTEIKNEFSQYADENGNLNQDKIEPYLKKIKEINDIDVDFEPEKKTISLVNGISFTVIEKLDKFFEFII